MRFLLDTCVVSEIRNPVGSVSVKKAVDAIASADMFLSVITLGEIAKGIALLEPGRRKRELSAWIQGLERDFADSLLPVDSGTASIWGDITALCQKAGKNLPACDGLIAATAMRHGLYVMTRNVADFAATGAMLLNPWDEA